jgi:DNA replication protein DnaC
MAGGNTVRRAPPVWLAPHRTKGSLSLHCLTSLEEAQAAGALLHRMKTLTHPALLVVHEIGCLPVSRSGARHFSQLMSRRYEHASTVLTSNKSCEEWGRSSEMRSWPPP